MPDDLERAFWRALEGQVATATDLWLGLESGDQAQGAELRRLLHTVKGDGYMLGLEEVGDVLQVTESLVERFGALATETPRALGDLVLRVLETLGTLSQSGGDSAGIDLPALHKDLGDFHATVAHLPRIAVADLEPANTTSSIPIHQNLSIAPSSHHSPENDALSSEEAWVLIGEEAESFMDHWLAAEEGDVEAAQMLAGALERCVGIAVHVDQHEPRELIFLLLLAVREVLEQGQEKATKIADVMLGSVEVLSFLASGPEARADVDCQPLMQGLRKHVVVPDPASFSLQPEAEGERPSFVVRDSVSVGAVSASESAADSVPAPDAGRGDGTVAQGADAVLELDEMVPLAHELLRLHAEQPLLLSRLRDVQRMVRALLSEIDPSASPEELAERIVKTLGYGSDIESKLSLVRAEWSTNMFKSGQALDQVSDCMRRASLVSVRRLEGQVIRAARTAGRMLGKEVKVAFLGDAYLDASIEKRLAPVLLHLVRNAVDHGIESESEREAVGKPAAGSVSVSVSQGDADVEVVVRDDGAGIDVGRLRAKMGALDPRLAELPESELINCIFRHGVSTREEVNELSGRGVGLDVVAEGVAAVGGRIELESKPGKGCVFVITMPATLRGDVVVPLWSGKSRVAVPARSVEGISRAKDLELTTEGTMIRHVVEGEVQLIPVWSMGTALGMGGDVNEGDSLVVLKQPAGYFALTVDRFESPRPVTFTASEDLSFSSMVVRGVAPSPDGGVLMMLDSESLFSAVRESRDLSGKGAGRAGQSRTGRRVLVAEDAPVARELLCGILRSFGLRVMEAEDGRKGIEMAREHSPDLIITDVEMPFVDGIEMVSAIRTEVGLEDVPVLVLTTRTDEATRERARAVGVRGYISKQRFVEEELRRLVDACLEAA